MKVKMTELIQPPLNLFRCDPNITQPQWDDKAVNPRYQYPELGPKNVAGLFFFTDSYESAERLAFNMVIEERKTFDLLTITHCEISRPVKFLDFTSCNNIYHMLCVLNDLGINVMNEKFSTFEAIGGPYQTNFAYLAPLYAEKELPENGNRGDLIRGMLLRPDESHSRNVRLFGQRLSDFANGKIFKELIQKGYPDIDGYRWCESEKEGEYTYCFFESEALTLPKIQKYISEEEQREVLEAAH